MLLIDLCVYEKDEEESLWEESAREKWKIHGNPKFIKSGANNKKNNIESKNFFFF